MYLLIPAASFTDDAETPYGKAPAAFDSPGAAAPGPESKVIAYYFHRTWRCETCLTIETYAEETVKTHFADRLTDGRLEWHAVDFSMEENEHFEIDFKLEYHSLILSEETKEGIGAWRNLEKVWDLVEEKAKFQEYVRAEVSTFLYETEKRGNQTAGVEKTDE